MHHSQQSRARRGCGSYPETDRCRWTDWPPARGPAEQALHGATADHGEQGHGAGLLVLGVCSPKIDPLTGSGRGGGGGFGPTSGPLLCRGSEMKREGPQIQGPPCPVISKSCWLCHQICPLSLPTATSRSNLSISPCTLASSGPPCLHLPLPGASPSVGASLKTQHLQGHDCVCV